MAGKKEARNRKPREYGDPERVQEESSYEIGMDESWKANMKLTYDSILQNWQSLLARSQTAHDSQVTSLISNMDLATKNIIAQCQLNMTQAAENHRHGADRLWAGTDTAQGAVDVATIRATTLDDLALKIAGLQATVESFKE